MKKLSFLVAAILASLASLANNISVTSVSLTGQNTSAGVNNAANFTMIQFSVTWENSHRVSFGPNNWDAAWVFAKYRVNGGTWEHARLNNTGHVAPVGSSVIPGLLNQSAAFNATTNPGMGCFVYRGSSGTGTYTATNAQMRWNYGANGIADNAVVEVQVYAIEMVFVPQGAFNAGGGGGTNAFTSTTISTGTATTAPTGTGSLGGQAGGYPTGQTAPANATWPNGFNSFYMMKYEISQQQYVDFLNALPTAQATSRNASAATSRLGISVSGGVYSTSGPNLPMANLSWADFAAYLDWSGLRPMTELEFEKACRGTLNPVPGEFAWGTASAVAASGITNSGAANEIPTNTDANCTFAAVATPVGPLRVGSFARATSTRSQGGATYYGAMDMSGNVFELCISIANTEGRAYTGTHGDGSLSTTGDHNVTSWPLPAATLGFRLKGGAFAAASSFMPVSDRSEVGGYSGTRSAAVGGRGVRTAP